MITQELPLFTTREVITELESIKTKSISFNQPHQYKTLDNALRSIFPQQSEENKTARTKRLLGEIAHALSNEQIENINSEFQYLIDTWLDAFEKQVFEGKTLSQLLHNKEYVSTK